jgi:hypothetical protein
MSNQKKINQLLLLFSIYLSIVMTKPAHASWVTDRIGELFVTNRALGVPPNPSDKILEIIVAPSHRDASSGKTYKRLFFRLLNAGWQYYLYQPHDPVQAHEASIFLATVMEAKSSDKMVTVIFKECRAGVPTGCANQVVGLQLSNIN